MGDGRSKPELMFPCKAKGVSLVTYLCFKVWLFVNLCKASFDPGKFVFYPIHVFFFRDGSISTQGW